jgi:hypothetical protein
MLSRGARRNQNFVVRLNSRIYTHHWAIVSTPRKFNFILVRVLNKFLFYDFSEIIVSDPAHNFIVSSLNNKEKKKKVCPRVTTALKRHPRLSKPAKSRLLL